jgi:predicted RNA binding protein YcfA (HicA-like mRNA interferase family)
MGSVPVLKPAEVCRLLERLGFNAVRQRGLHIQYRHADGRGTTVPRSRGPPSLRCGAAGPWLKIFASRRLCVEKNQYRFAGSISGKKRFSTPLPVPLPDRGGEGEPFVAFEFFRGKDDFA